MNKTKPGLGRGLDALINPHNLKHENETISYQELPLDDGKQYDILTKIPLSLIGPNPFQPRLHFDQESLEDLKKSILSNGLIQPITVRRIEGNKYQLISGERRLRACSDIGFKDIPAYIIRVDSDEAMLAMALIENLQREKLNPIEIGMAYRRLMDECRLTQEQIADKIGKDRTTIANTIRLLKLPLEIQNAIISEEITSGHARALINIQNEELQLQVLKKIREGNLSVRKVEELVKRLISEKNVNFKKNSFKSLKTTQSSAISDVEDKLRRLFGTKVLCRQKADGTGDILIEFYSNEELERLFELFEIIDKSYS